MRFLLDHDVPDRLAGVLVQAGHEVTRLRDVLPIDSDDATVLEAAARSRAILVTCNRDDFLCLASTMAHRGIVILIRRETRIAECASMLRLLERAGPAGLESNVNFA